MSSIYLITWSHTLIHCVKKVWLSLQSVPTTKFITLMIIPIKWQHSPKKEFPFPYLHDAKQKVAKAYQAACTPDFFLFDENKTLFYRGQYDGSRPGNEVQPSGDDLNKAVQAIFDNSPPPKIQTPSMGCNIKWISGNEPSYFPKQN